MYHDNKLSTVGGISYIIGLLLLIIGRLIVILIFNFSVIITEFKNGGDSLMVELGHFLTGSGDWILWSTIAASTKHQEMKRYIREQLTR